MWGNKVITVKNTYRSLAVTFSSPGTWDVHLAKLHISARGNVNQLAKFLYNKDLDTCIKFMLIEICLPPVLEYGSDVWHASKSQTGLLKTHTWTTCFGILFHPGPNIIGCFCARLV